jgi:hypothetical protein
MKRQIFHYLRKTPMMLYLLRAVFEEAIGAGARFKQSGRRTFIE